jgi:hypothetical protein
MWPRGWLGVAGNYSPTWRFPYDYFGYPKMVGFIMEKNGWFGGTPFFRKPPYGGDYHDPVIGSCSPMTYPMIIPLYELGMIIIHELGIPFSTKARVLPANRIYGFLLPLLIEIPNREDVHRADSKTASVLEVRIDKCGQSATADLTRWRFQPGRRFHRRVGALEKAIGLVVYLVYGEYIVRCEDINREFRWHLTEWCHLERPSGWMVTVFAKDGGVRQVWIHVYRVLPWNFGERPKT